MLNLEDKQSPYTGLSIALLIFGGIIAGFIISKIFIFTLTVTDSSMNPGLKPGDQVLVLKTVAPKLGDIIVFDSPVEPDRVLIKRIIAAGGDTIEFKNKAPYINGKPFVITWKTINNDRRVFPMSFTYRDQMPPVKVRDASFFVIGDNLDKSYDSRAFGVISKDSIIGKVICIF
jgi:signal peptidase I